jgi:hypothetical protein
VVDFAGRISTLVDMNWRLAIVFLALGMASSATLDAQTSDPRTGHWAEQRGPGSRGLHVTYEDLGDGRYRLTLGAHVALGSRQIVEMRCDGGTYPYVFGSGTPSGNTLSCRATGPRSFEYLYTQADQKVWATSTGVETVSDDGNTLTWVATHKDANGRAVEELRTQFSRRDDEPPSN